MLRKGHYSNPSSYEALTGGVVKDNSVSEDFPVSNRTKQKDVIVSTSITHGVVFSVVFRHLDKVSPISSATRRSNYKCMEPLEVEDKVT